jgi:hypothetical protein
VQFFFRHSNCYGIRSLTTPSPSPFLLLLLLFCSCVQSTFTLCNIPIPSRFICLIRTNCFRAQIRNGSGSGAILIKSNTILFHGSHGLLPQLRSLFRRWWLKFATFSPCELHNLRNSGGRQGRLCATSLHRTGVRLTFDYPKKNHVSPRPGRAKMRLFDWRPRNFTRVSIKTPTRQIRPPPVAAKLPTSTLVPRQLFACSATFSTGPVSYSPRSKSSDP